MIQILTFGNTNKKEFLVNGPDKICGRGQATYSTSYSVARIIAWEITGGQIVAINGLGISEFYNSYMPDEEVPTDPIVKFEYNTLGSGSATYIVNGQESSVELSQEIFYALLSNPANTITVDWTPYYNPQSGIVFTNPGRVTAHGAGLGEFGIDGSGVYTRTTTFESSPQISLIQPNNLNLNCGQNTQIGWNTNSNNNVVWSAPGAVVTSTWINGFYIDHFNTIGTVPITVAVGNTCGIVYAKVNFNIVQPDYGEVQQNGINVSGSDASEVQLDCQGNFYLGIPKWVSNSSVYTWTLPDQYNPQTNTYSVKKISGNNLANVSGQLPSNGLTDFVGNVTITGLCGGPVVKTFIVRPTLRPSVDADIYSCSNTVVIKVNNPNGNSPINAWVASSTPSGRWGSFANNTSTSTTFTASSPGNFVIDIGLNINGCYTPLQTTVHAVSAGNNTNAGTSGWQAGVLSDNRKAPGSNLATYNGNIYFTGRDGIIYYYNFNNGLQKWIINQIPGISNASIPAASSFNKIGIATQGATTYLFYTDNTGLFKKVDLSTYSLSPGIGIALNATDVVAGGNEMYVIEKNTSVLKTINGTSVINLATLPGASLKIPIPGYGVAYMQNNNLFTTSSGQLTFSNDVYASSDVVAFGGYIYYARGQKGAANLYRLPIGSTGPGAQITTTSNLSGVFTINPASGVIYYGILEGGSLNSIATVTSGGYRASNIYQAHLQNGSWVFNAATLVKPREHFDMYIQSPVYGGNHVYYIGAGFNNQIGERYELEVWNLYYENACAPAIQRVSDASATTEVASSVNIYPNPFTTVLQLDLSTYMNLETDALTDVEVEVLDASGKTAYKHTLLSELSTLSTADWAAGMYLIKIKHKGIIVTKKAIKLN